MKPYQERFAGFLAHTGALFFADNLTLKDGRPTPYFVNMGKFNTGSGIKALGELYASLLCDLEPPGGAIVNGIDVLFGPSYKGSPLAVATAIALDRYRLGGIRYEFDRKEAKTHGDATDQPKLFVTNAFSDGARIGLIDDVATSMATKYESLEKIAAEDQRNGWQLPVKFVAIGVDRQQTQAVYDSNVPIGLTDRELSKWKKEHVVLGEKGEDAISTFTGETGIPVYSIATITDVVDHLHHNMVPVLINGREQSIDNKTLDTFHQYMETYGVGR